MPRRHNLALAILVRCLLTVALAGCTTLRDSYGTVHDGDFNANQTHALVTNAPLLIPFVPPAVALNTMKASIENGSIHVAGHVVDDAGNDLPGVTLTASPATLVGFDINNDAALLAEQTQTRQTDGPFTFDFVGIHTLNLEFSKPGYESRKYHVEIIRDGGYRWEHPENSDPSIRLITGPSPLSAEKLTIVLTAKPSASLRRQ